MITWHDFQGRLWCRLLFEPISQLLPKLSHNCLWRFSVTEFIKSLYYDVVLVIHNANIWTLKTITTHSNSPSVTPPWMWLQSQKSPTGLPDIKFRRRRRQPHCPCPAPSDKSAELHHLTSRMKQVCRWDKQWKIGDIFPLSLSEASINIRDLHIFNPVLRSFQQIPIPAEKWGHSLGAYLSDIWSCVYVNPRLLIFPSSPPLPLADHQAPLWSTGGSAQCPAVTCLGECRYQPAMWPGLDHSSTEAWEKGAESKEWGREVWNAL